MLIVDFPERPQSRTPLVPATQGEARVRFSSSIETEYFIEDLAPKYKEDLWFTGDEIRSFRERAARVLGSIKSSGLTIAQWAEMNVDETGM